MIRPKGIVTAGYIDVSTGLVFGEQPAVENDFLFEGADILGNLVAGRSEYIPNMAYIEFVNADPAPAISVSRGDGRSYYAGLETSGPPLNRDYLRVPLLFSPQTEASSDDYTANRVRWVIMSSGDAGVGGLEFSSAAASEVYGFALVAAPDLNDRSRDLVFARVYLDTPLPKLATSQIQARWPYLFE